MASPERQGEFSQADIYRDLLDERFALGAPRRHNPGNRLGEEEIFLEPPKDMLLMGHLPERLRAIRPKADNTAPVRERGPRELTGHRLEVVWLAKPGQTVSW